ncbi:MAG: BamA/TamA family outer membrane protein [Bacteroidota bacterium]
MKYIRLILLSIILLTSLNAQGQYFGRNPVQYNQFDFKILETPHFDIYNYLEDSIPKHRFGEQAEHWYYRHQAVFNDTIEDFNPLVLYNNHEDFQQNTISNSIMGRGTGGFTEGLRTRVVMPVSPSNRETDHVLGHELVHVFQYRMFKNDSSLNISMTGNVPLWMIEGLAEYMSIGHTDHQTAMTMRDAVMHDDLPTFKDLSKEPNKYFPYRYGHAAWTFLTGMWGDGIIKPLLRKTAMHGYEAAMDSVFKLPADSVSKLWHNALKEDYKPALKEKPAMTGEGLFTKENAGTMNLAPSLSPDGNYITFVSNKNVISTDFYLGNLKTGKIEKELTKRMKESRIDSYSYLESAGTWSPDSRRYAFSAFIKGKKKLIIVNVETGEREATIAIPGIDSFNNPSWSPDGESIAISGLVDGRSDIYIYNLKDETVNSVTNDPYSDMQPEWSPDGEKIVFMSDRGQTGYSRQGGYPTYQICEYNLEEDRVHMHNFLPGADNTTPQYGPDSETIYFLSNAGGYRNIYEFNTQNEELFRLTDIATGISGITELSPALSVARETNKIAFIHYDDDSYSIRELTEEDFSRKKVEPRQVDMHGAKLSRYTGQPPIDVVGPNLTKKPGAPLAEIKEEPYKPRFKLEHIGNSGIGVGVNQMNTGLAGGVNLLFSDILKRNQLFTAVQANGEVYDIGGQVAYMNKGSQLNWGVSLGHIPYRSSNVRFEPDTIEGEPVQNLMINRLRIFEDQLSVFSHYPISRNLRIEGGVTASRYSFRYDRINNYFLGNIPVGRNKEELEAPDPYYIYEASMAYVGDASRFGLTSPLEGYRYRFQAQKMIGRHNFWGALADYRKYYFNKPVGLAFRAMHYGRYGGESENMPPYYLGNEKFIRGYANAGMEDNQLPGTQSLSLNNLAGNRLAVINGEVRIPFTGPKRLAPIKSGKFFSDLVGFVDGGLIWDENSSIDWSWEPSEGKQIPVFSAGIAARINVFGYVVVQPYYAFPFQRPQKNGTFGFHISTGGW